MHFSKRRQLTALSNPNGVIAATAMDQRERLRSMLAAAKECDPAAIPDDMLGEFKLAVTRILSPYSSAILLDTEWGLHAAAQRAADCGLLLTYESDTFRLTGARMPSLIPHLSVRRLADLGAQGIKVLVLYNPDEDPLVNEAKKAFIERVGAECTAHHRPFFLEFVANDVTPETKPRAVIDYMHEFSKQRYRVDVLKVEFPFHPSHTRAQKIEFCRRAAEVCSKPFIYLSAGVNHPEFLDSLEIAAASGARYSGVLCGRATWQDGIPAYVRQGMSAFEDWLADQGTRNMLALNAALTGATPWRAFDKAASSEAGA